MDNEEVVTLRGVQNWLKALNESGILNDHPLSEFIDDAERVVEIHCVLYENVMDATEECNYSLNQM